MLLRIACVPKRCGFHRGQKRRDRISVGRNQVDRLPALAADLVSRRVDMTAALGLAASVWDQDWTLSRFDISSKDRAGGGVMERRRRARKNLLSFTCLRRSREEHRL